MGYYLLVDSVISRRIWAQTQRRKLIGQNTGIVGQEFVPGQGSTKVGSMMFLKRFRIKYACPLWKRRIHWAVLVAYGKGRLRTYKCAVCSLHICNKMRVAKTELQNYFRIAAQHLLTLYLYCRVVQWKNLRYNIRGKFCHRR